MHNSKQLEELEEKITTVLIITEANCLARPLHWTGEGRLDRSPVKL